MPATTTDPDVALSLWLQLHDSAFPAGRLVHSHGLEEWLAARPAADAVDLEAAVCGYLTHGYAPLDATITAHAWNAVDCPGSLAELDELTGTYKLFGNARTASTSTGQQLAATALDIGIADGHTYLVAVRDGNAAGHAAVVDGVVQARLGVPQRLAVLGSLRSMLASLLSAAVRLGRLGPLQSQRIQLRSTELAVRLAREACLRSLPDLSGTAPALEISGMRHEERTSRLFAT
ncbi:urease accessory protein UreF [Mycolicibacterium mageritense]|uniref:Urease accessory protein UreF n=1 Tax=Mycolicibacterium mageritense TaxID=53462 RepID=A0AAI8TQF1_MYCME|nr:urease accessory UreF family protein [Mycolicibacterium mageritense]TXI61883.1 MAG: urease accessory protein UreF [Mycolicibacterium mageritense]BDY27060.1 Urease accessory protein UreF [Mycolicibacterium mageritense]